MTINISYVFTCICNALASLVLWMKTNYIQFGLHKYSIFDIELTALAIALVLESFIPWAGGDDDE